jgi:hypothetical protein
VELYPGWPLFDEASLALGCDFHPFGIFGWISEAAESPIAPVVGIGSLGVGVPFPYST